MIPQTCNPLLETSSSEIQPQDDFKFYKSQEIPEFRYSLEESPPSEATLSKAQSEDYLDFLVTLTDNGDDKLCLSGKYFQTLTLIVPVGPTPSSLQCTLHHCPPTLTETRLLLAGSGHSAYLREIKVKQVERQPYFKGSFGGLREGHLDCCCQIV